MKKFTFSLEKLLRYKETLYDKEKNALGTLRAERIAVEQRLEENARQAAEADAGLKQEAARGTTILRLRTFQYQIENARRLEKQYELELIAADERIERQLQVVLELQKEISALEKLREKQRAEYDYDVQREESETIGELVSSRYTRSKAEPEE